MTPNPRIQASETDSVVGKGSRKDGKGQLAGFLLGKTSLRNFCEEAYSEQST